MQLGSAGWGGVGWGQVQSSFGHKALLPHLLHTSFYSIISTAYLNTDATLSSSSTLPLHVLPHCHYQLLPPTSTSSWPTT